MKKIITIALTGLLVLGLAFTGVANAQSPKDKAREMPQMGTVERISANSVILKAPGMDFITIEVTTNDETVYYDATGELEKGEKPPEIKWNEIKKGDKIVARGKIVREDEDSPTSYLAISVTKINQFPRPERPGDDKGNDNKDDIIGTFKHFDGEYMIISHKFENNRETRIKVTDETQYVMFEKDEDNENPKRVIKLKDDLEEGQIVGIKIEKQKNTDGEMEDVAKVVVFHQIKKEMVAGKITEISSTSISIKLLKNSEPKTFLIDEETNFLKMKKDRKTEEITLSDLEADDTVIIEYRNETAKIITKIRKQP